MKSNSVTPIFMLSGLMAPAPAAVSQASASSMASTKCRVPRRGSVPLGPHTLTGPSARPTLEKLPESVIRSAVWSACRWVRNTLSSVLTGSFRLAVVRDGAAADIE